MKRNRKRYVLFKLHMDGSFISDKKLSFAIWKNLLSLYGEICAADSKFYLTQYDTKSGVGVLQCNATSLEQVLAAAAVIGTIENTQVSFEPKKTSGTIKALKS